MYNSITFVLFCFVLQNIYALIAVQTIKNTPFCVILERIIEDVEFFKDWLNNDF